MKYNILPSGLNCQARISGSCHVQDCLASLVFLLGRVCDASPGPTCPLILPFPQPGKISTSSGVRFWVRVAVRCCCVAGVLTITGMTLRWCVWAVLRLAFGVGLTLRTDILFDSGCFVVGNMKLRFE